MEGDKFAGDKVAGDKIAGSKAGRDVIDIGTVPTPLLYFATRYLECNSGVMITGSHNPAEFNGFKIVIDQQTIAAGGIQSILETIRAVRSMVILCT